jgi:hypothetical protein
VNDATNAAEIESLRAELARAREVIDAKNPVSYCTHCLTQFPRGRAGIDAFRAHIPERSRHPLATAMRNKAFAVKVALRCLRERNESREELRKVRAERDALATMLRELAAGLREGGVGP